VVKIVKRDMYYTEIATKRMNVPVVLDGQDFYVIHHLALEIAMKKINMVNA
jgi:hypothetical protein